MLRPVDRVWAKAVKVLLRGWLMQFRLNIGQVGLDRCGKRVYTALVLLFLWLPLVGSAETLWGHAEKIRDGDTIVVSGVPVRLQGVAAPELKQKWGRASKSAMQRLVAGQRLRCELTGEKTHDRKVGTCFLDDGTDIGAAIIEEGLARDCPRYSHGRYAANETDRSRTLPFPDYCIPR